METAFFNLDKVAQTELLFLGLISANSHLADSGNTQVRRLSLLGLEGVYPVVENVKPEIEKDGLTRQQFEEDTRKSLEDAGIQVLTEQGHQEDERHPLLVINPHILKIESELIKKTVLYIYNLNIELSQKAYLLRELFPGVPATTWRIDLLGCTPDLAEVRESFRELLHIFTEAFLSVNLIKERS